MPAFKISLSTPHMSDEGYELEYIHDAFQKNWIAPLGENVTAFEADIREFIGAKYSTALSAGTAALHLAIILSGVGMNDTVYCQDLTFCATVNPVTYNGGVPVFIDSEPDTWNMDPAALQKAIDLYGVPKAVVLAHLYGNPAKLSEICEICEKYNIPLIEDAAEALGADYHGRKCGTFGKFGILSFNGNKIITTSGGGMLLCKEEADAAHALKLATQAREPFPWYQHEEIGYNYRMSNISAGIGRGQAKVLPNRVAKKRDIFRQYCEKLSDLPLTMQPCLPEAVSNNWLSVFILDHDCKLNPDHIISKLKNNGIEARHLWKPMHAQPIFAQNRFVSLYENSISDDLFRRGVCLPSDTKLTEEQIDEVCEVIHSLF